MNFNPSADEKKFLEEHLDSLQAHIPSESHGVARFRKEKGFFFGCLEIQSMQGEFVCTEKNALFRPLVEELHKKLQAQIHSWQQQRFEKQKTEERLRHRWYGPQDVAYITMFNVQKT